MYAGHFDFSHPLLWTVPEVLSAEECQRLLAQLASSAWLKATVNRKEGRVVKEDLRNNTLAIVRDEELHQTLQRRLLPHLPSPLSERSLAGLKRTMRCYRYEVGEFFGLHSDQSYSGEDGTQSLLTCMVYLNDDCEGGETRFPEIHECISPQRGMALLFQHMVLHEGCAVTKGTKYVLRTDVLYNT